MSDHLLVATRKGLFELARTRSGWKADVISFAGVPVTNALRVNGTFYAALKHGHFRPKLHHSDDEGKSWREIGTPAFPADAADAFVVPDLVARCRRAASSRPAVDRRHSRGLVPLRRPR